MRQTRIGSLIDSIYAKIAKVVRMTPPPLRFFIVLSSIFSLWLVLYFFPATESYACEWYPPCPFHALTGFHCSGCGALRGMSCLAKGDIFGAWRKNKLMVLTLPYLFWKLLVFGLECCGFNNLGTRRKCADPRWIWALLIVVILYWILRNIPCYPFTLLAPY